MELIYSPLYQTLLKKTHRYPPANEVDDRDQQMCVATRRLPISKVKLQFVKMVFTYRASLRI